jgi:hypothetical protein
MHMCMRVHVDDCLHLGINRSSLVCCMQMRSKARATQHGDDTAKTKHPIESSCMEDVAHINTFLISGLSHRRKGLVSFSTFMLVGTVGVPWPRNWSTCMRVPVQVSVVLTASMCRLINLTIVATGSHVDSSHPSSLAHQAVMLTRHTHHH